MKVTNYETSKKLKELGFKSKTTAFYRKFNGNYELFHSIEPLIFEVNLPAYDLEQILEMLPKELNRNFLILKCWYSVQPDKIKYFTDNVGEYAEYRKEGENLATTAARLLIKLIEDGIINLKDNKND